MAGPARATPAAWFRIGDGYLGLASDDREFQGRFTDLYRECAVDAPGREDGPVVTCAVRREADRIRVTFEDPEPLDQFALSASLLEAVSFSERPARAPGWRVLGAAGREGVLEFSGNEFVADATSPWQTVASALAIHRVQRLQRHVLFFHAASVGLGDAGMLIFGDKGAGKTTLALALAERGHRLLGDETAAIRTRTLELLPLRRRLSIRPGPAAPGVARALANGTWPVVRLPDGTTRTHLHPAALLPGDAPAPVVATVMVFLGAEATAARARRLTPTRDHLLLLQPFESATWDAPPAAVAVRLLGLLGRLRCYEVARGGVAETTRVLEDLMEEAE